MVLVLAEPVVERGRPGVPVRPPANFDLVMLQLRLTQLAADQVAGIYQVGKRADGMPDRLRWLHPDTAIAFATIASWAVVSDMLRSPESSLEAVRRGRGAQPPGYSAHNFGFAVDLDIGESSKRLAKRIGRAKVSKAEIDAAMEAAGWFCHRRDHTTASEAWHYNHLGIGTVIGPQFKSTAGWVEAKIVQVYGADLAPNDRECQVLLASLRMYQGTPDGKVGALTKEATRVFQRGWGLRETGTLEKRTRRTLALVACERRIVVERVAAAA